MYLMKGKRLAGPWIRDAVGCRNDDVACNQRTGASRDMPVAGHIDLTNCSPRFALPVDHSSVVTATDDTRPKIACVCLSGDEGARDAHETVQGFSRKLIHN